MKALLIEESCGIVNIMKICFLAPADSIHIVKWCHYFISHGHDVHVISFTKGEIPDATVHYVDCGAIGSSKDIKKLLYLLKAKEIRRLIDQIQPDIINAHYATSYGAVAALSGSKNYIVSVWGSDIYDFPQKSVFHKALLKYSLNHAPYLFSTSRAMAEEAAKYTNKPFEITPFGVDTELFSPTKRTRLAEDKSFVVGTVKGLSYKYGIDYLIKAVAIVKKEHPEVPIHLRIAGKGPQEQEFKALAETEGIADITTWLGYITQEEAATEWTNMDLAVVPSVFESFGVSAVEAQSCECPIIISEVPGLMEATVPGVSCFVVPCSDEMALAEAIYGLYLDQTKRHDLGQEGRNYVLETYEYNQCFHKVERLFKEYRGKNKT